LLIIVVVTRLPIPLSVLTSWSKGKFLSLPPILSLPKSEGSPLRKPIVNSDLPKLDWGSAVSSSHRRDPGEGSSTLRGKRKRAPSSSDLEVISIAESLVAVRSPARKRSKGNSNVVDLDLFTNDQY
jgi:hypothetical protein